MLYAPIRDLFREANGTEDAVWRERVEQFIDLRQVVRHVAIETFLTEDDGFIGAFGMNNFYLYRPAGSSIHRLLPWNKDNTFADVNRSIFARTNENVLIDRALGCSDLRVLYLDVLDECARSAADGDCRAAMASRSVFGQVRVHAGHRRAARPERRTIRTCPWRSPTGGT